MIINKQELSELESRANAIRKDIVRMIANAGAGHPGGSLSIVEVIVCLYYKLMRIDPTNPRWPERDRFVLSKGHSSPTLYVALAELGFFSKDHLMTFDHVNSILQGHPDMKCTPGIDMSTGSLGQGLSAGVGMALAGRLKKQDFHVYVLLGDGELQEGQIWEAIMLADKYRVDNLTVIVDENMLQLMGPIEQLMPASRPMQEKWRTFGWNVLEMDGHNIPEILETLTLAKTMRGAPCVVFSHTIKGKGVSFMENQAGWHSRGLTADELSKALSELNVFDTEVR
jgi:transketolase